MFLYFGLQVPLKLSKKQIAKNEKKRQKEINEGVEEQKKKHEERKIDEQKKRENKNGKIGTVKNEPHHKETCLCIFKWSSTQTSVLSKQGLVIPNLSLVVRKPVFGVSDQVRHKPDCTATEDF